MKQVSRYHPLLVTLHWVLAILIIAALIIGSFWLAAMPNSDPQKIVVLRVHMDRHAGPVLDGHPLHRANANS